MKLKLGIGQKVIMVVVAVLVLFTVVLALLVRTTSLNNLTAVKQAELERMSEILAGQVAGMERNAAQTDRSFEESAPIVSEVQLMTNLGPYYADPGVYLPADFEEPGDFIEDAAKIYTFQAQLNLVQQLRSVQRLNNFTTISFYAISPFEIVPSAKPTLALQLNPAGIMVTQFNSKGPDSQPRFYFTSWQNFRPPSAETFDISSAYSAPPEQYYAENNFNIVETANFEFPAQNWEKITEPRSLIVVRDGQPVIQTWYPVKMALLHPETWDEATVPAGVAVVEQVLGQATLASIKADLGLDVAFAQNGQLLNTSLGVPISNQTLSLTPGEALTLGDNNYYFARNPIEFSDATPSGLEAVVLSPVSELEQLNQLLNWQILWVSAAAIILVGVIFYFGIQYLVSRPLNGLMQGVRLITAGDLSQTIAAQSQDELGQLGRAFNGMAGQLRQLIGSLEQQVVDRTKGLETVNTLGERLNSILDFDQLLAELVEQVKNQFGYYHVQVYIVDPARKNIVLLAGVGEAGEKMKAAGHYIPQNAPASLVAKAVRQGVIIRVDDTAKAKDWLPNPLLPHTRSEMAVPIVLENQVVGVLDVQEDKIEGFDEGDANLLRSLANQVAVAIRNARLFEQVETALSEARAAQERYVEQAWDKAKTVSRQGQYVLVQSEVAPLAETRLQTLARLRNEAKEADQPLVASVGQGDAQAKTLVAPIKLRNKKVGMVQLYADTGAKAWTESDLTVIETILDQLAQTAENLRLFDETRLRATQEQTIREVTDKLRAAPNLDLLLKTAARELGSRLGVQHTVLELGIDNNRNPSAPGQTELA